MSELLKKLIKHMKDNFGEIAIDSKVSILHYRLTTSILLICCALVSSQQYFGEPIKCIQDGEGDDAAVAEHILNTFCFIASTYTVLNDEDYGSWSGIATGMTRKHSYYQWVPLILFLQALLFTGPHALWSYMENGLLKGCISAIKNQLIEFKDQQAHISILSKYISLRLNSFHTWGIWFILSETLNTFNVYLNFCITDQMLSGQFSNYGFEIYKYLSQEKAEESPFDNIFPKLTKCNFYKYGPTGTIQKLDALCLMTLNIVNEKVYTFLWVWFLFLGLISILGLILRIWTLLIIAYKPRCEMMRKCYPISKECYNKKVLVNKLCLSDWIFLGQLKENLDPQTYSKIIDHISLHLHNSSVAIWNDSNKNIVI